MTDPTIVTAATSDTSTIIGTGVAAVTASAIALRKIFMMIRNDKSDMIASDASDSVIVNLQKERDKAIDERDKAIAESRRLQDKLDTMEMVNAELKAEIAKMCSDINHMEKAINRMEAELDMVNRKLMEVSEKYMESQLDMARREGQLAAMEIDFEKRIMERMNGIDQMGNGK